MQTEQFVRFLVLKGMQPITILGYEGGARRFTEITGAYPSRDQARKYMADIYSGPHSFSHKKNTALAVEKYMEFIGSPARFGRQKKPRSMVKNTLTEPEVATLLSHAKNIREKAILALLAYSGVRNREFCNLRLKDFDPARNMVRVIQGKGMKDGTSSITPECARVVLQYLEEYPRGEEEFLFTTLKRKGRYSEWALRDLVKEVAKRSGFTKAVYPHLLRHSLSVNMVMRGADMLTLKNQLRHAHFETTFLYLNSILVGFRNEYDKVAPEYLSPVPEVALKP